MDVAITGEGFFQVMDSDGNIFYTRAGNLQLDNNSGNLVDANGYTVLGVTGDPLERLQELIKYICHTGKEQCPVR